jgi:hypothetical protein
MRKCPDLSYFFATLLRPVILLLEVVPDDIDACSSQTCMLIYIDNVFAFVHLAQRI